MSTTSADNRPPALLRLLLGSTLSLALLRRRAFRRRTHSGQAAAEATPSSSHHATPTSPPPSNLCGADAGALLIETALTQRVVAALRACGAQPEPYREPPGRRTRVLWASHLPGRFGNPSAVAPLRRTDGEEVPLERCRAVPVIEPGASMLAAFHASDDEDEAEADDELIRTIPADLLCLLREGRASWRPMLRIPTADTVLVDSGKAPKPVGSGSSRSPGIATHATSATSATGSRASAAAAAIVNAAPQPPAVTAATARFRFAELFAGIGGFRVGLEAIGGQCVFASEIDARARGLYALNFGEGPPGVETRAFAGDITKVSAADVAPHDVLVGGFPCQPFSTLGDQPGIEGDDDKGRLFLEITRLLDFHRPKAFLLENVPGILACGGAAGGGGGGGGGDGGGSSGVVGGVVGGGGGGGGDGGDGGDGRCECSDGGGEGFGDGDDAAAMASVGSDMTAVVRALQACGRDRQRPPTAEDRTAGVMGVGARGGEYRERGGYHVLWRTINSASRTAQRRNRVYIVGFRRDIAVSAAKVAAKATGKTRKTSGKRARSINTAQIDAAPSLTAPANAAPADATHATAHAAPEARMFFQWPAELDRDCGLTAGSVLETEVDLRANQPALLEAITLSESQWARLRRSKSFKARMASRLVWPDRLAGTLTKSYHQDLLGHAQVVPRPPPHRPRFLTPRECARLHGFPEWFRTSRRPEDQADAGKCGGGSAGFNEWWRFYPCIGNAVSPPVIRDIGAAMLDTIELAELDT